MITINATGDTTLHTAGKYCPEDILVKVPAGGSGGGSVETCTVTINTPMGITLIGYGTFDLEYEGTALGTYTMPSTMNDVHVASLPLTRIFNSIPVGSVFTFVTQTGTSSSVKITGASVTDNIEFSLVNIANVNQNKYYAAICRCNGDGEITITD